MERDLVGVFGFGPKDQARQAPAATVNGNRQREPERPGTVQRRYRLFVECARRLDRHPLTSESMYGVPIGDGLGMESLVAEIAPLLSTEPTLTRWVALRGALAALYVHTFDPSSRSVPFYPVVETAMGVGHVGDLSVGNQTLGVSPENALIMPPEQVAAAVGLFAAVRIRLGEYETYSHMTVDQVNDEPQLRFNNAVALDLIAWSAVALHRLGLARPLIDTVPEPDMLEAPGWYTDPLFGKAERYWDGNDWTIKCRIQNGRKYAYLDGAL